MWPVGESKRMASPWPSSVPAAMRSTVQPYRSSVGLVSLEVVDRLGLECDVLEPVAVRAGQHQRVMVLLVPALQVDVVVVAGDLAQPEHLGVVRGTEL